MVLSLNLLDTMPEVLTNPTFMTPDLNPMHEEQGANPIRNHKQGYGYMIGKKKKIHQNMAIEN